MHDVSSELQPQSERRSRVWPSVPISYESPVLCVVLGGVKGSDLSGQTGKQHLCPLAWDGDP